MLLPLDMLVCLLLLLPVVVVLLLLLLPVVMLLLLLLLLLVPVLMLLVIQGQCADPPNLLCNAHGRTLQRLLRLWQQLLLWLLCWLLSLPLQQGGRQKPCDHGSAVLRGLLINPPDLKRGR